MKKLLTVLVGVMLTMPLAGLEMSALSSVEASVDIRPVHGVTGMCWVFVGGRWQQVPC